jgi:hypothetical protein
MKRSSNLLLIAVALAVYGFYVASYVPTMLLGPAPGLLIAFILQTVFAMAAAIGVRRSQRWGAGAVVLLGISVVCTSLFEAFVLGIVGYLRALLVSVVVLIIAFIVAAYANGQSAVPKS